MVGFSRIFPNLLNQCFQNLKGCQQSVLFQNIFLLTSCLGGTYLGCFPQFLFFLTPFILEPDPDHPGAEPGHLRQLLLHQSVRSGVGAVAGLQDVQLLLRQHRPHLPCSTPSLTLRSSLPVFLILSRSYITVWYRVSTKQTVMRHPVLTHSQLSEPGSTLYFYV